MKIGSSGKNNPGVCKYVVMWIEQVDPEQGSWARVRTSQFESLYAARQQWRKLRKDVYVVSDSVTLLQQVPLDK